jgi:NitT/TauT family transport system permease protein
VTAFIALFRGSLLGFEAASVFAIFTGQAWNMTFSFYHALRSTPRELDEMATLPAVEMGAFHTFGAARFGDWPCMERHDELGGGWFFLAASEAISVLNRQYTLPGLGSYVGAAIAAQDIRALILARLSPGGATLRREQAAPAPTCAPSNCCWAMPTCARR